MIFCISDAIPPEIMQSQEKAKLTKTAAAEIFVSRENRSKVGVQAGDYTPYCK